MTVAIVTGGARGIGLGITRRLVDDGYRVAVNGVRPPDAVSGVMGQLGDQAVYVQGDVADADARDRIVSSAIEAFGRIDALVNNAGITSPGRNDMLDVTQEDLDRVLAVNLTGPFLLTQAVAAHMIDQRAADPGFRGCVVNISSISAVFVTTNRSEYCISKAGVSMASRLWSARLGEHGIDVYEVRPGIIRTDMTASVTEKYDTLFAEGIAIEARWGTPEDVASVVSVLVRGQMPYATGQVLTIDGGLTVPRL